MRLIFSFLALAQVRLARFDLVRSDMLMDNAEVAQNRARQRLAKADAFAHRAGFAHMAKRRL